MIYPILRREFYPDVDSGAFEMTVRAPSGTRIELTEERLAEVEDFLRKAIDPKDLQLFITEIGVTPDWSAAFTPNAGPMDAIVRVQLTAERSRSAQQYVALLRDGLADEPPVRRPGVRLRRRRHDPRGDERGEVDADQHPGHRQGPGDRPPDRRGDPRSASPAIDGVVDARVIQRLNYPEYMINVDRKKAADLGLTQEDVMRNVVAALNSSIQFNKNNFWIDPSNKNQYYVGVQYREEDIKTVETMLNIPVTGPKQTSAGAAPQPRHDRADERPDRGHALQHPAHDGADDGRLRAATSATSPTT